MACKIFAVSLLALLALVVFLPFTEIFRGDPVIPEGVRIGRVVVVKSEKRLYLAAGGRMLKSYPVALGKQSGPKQRQGDRRTPEGIYDHCRLRLQSNFYKAIYVTYPNAADLKKGCSGGDIEIHGLPRLPGGLEKFLGHWIVGWGWTEGCIMLRNQDMDEIIRVAAAPLTVEIRP